MNDICSSITSMPAKSPPLSASLISPSSFATLLNSLASRSFVLSASSRAAYASLNFPLNFNTRTTPRKTSPVCVTRASVVVDASIAACGSPNSLATRATASRISCVPKRMTSSVISASRTPPNVRSSVSRLLTTSSRIKLSMRRAPSARSATSSKVDVDDASLARERLNASRAYATASNDALVVVVVFFDCASPLNQLVN
mmetsp:Transcript_7349/g.26821  ORF Transcript_7349/g.26821 Transcript_7349/m.26821 type:complete len:200 (-) Transcript_7349:211-810(-)